MSRRALLADGLSLANGSCGLAGMLLLVAWDNPRALTVAAGLVFAAWGFDALDGAAARGLQRPPAEGAVLDSLCDTTSFGALPAVLLTAFTTARGLIPAATGIALGVLFFCCAVLRLRRYTARAVTAASTPRTFFEGLPSPVAAMSVAAAIMASGAASRPLTWMPLAFAGVCAPLMVSRIPYKDLSRLAAWLVRARWPLPVLAVIAWFAGAAAAATVFFAAYVGAGVIVRLTAKS